MDGTDVKGLRKNWGLRQGDMAALLGVTSSHLSRVETGILVSVAVEQILTILRDMIAASGKTTEIDAAVAYGKAMARVGRDVRQGIILLRLMQRSRRCGVNGVDVAMSVAEAAL
jgi:predicted transcriptional regulator